MGARVKNALISPLHHQTITLPPTLRLRLPTLPLPHHHHPSCNDSDSDSDEDAVKENQSGAAISRVIRIHNQFKYNEDGKEALQEPPTSSHDTNRPLSPLKNSSSKARIIDDLKNNKSSIYALIGSGWEANLDQLWQHYAPGYQLRKFKGCMKTIMDSSNAKKGAFGDFNVKVQTSNSCP